MIKSCEGVYFQPATISNPRTYRIARWSGVGKTKIKWWSLDVNQKPVGNFSTKKAAIEAAVKTYGMYS